MDMNLILASIGVFLVVVLLLVVILLVAKNFLVPSGNVKLTINGEKELEVASGSTLLNTLSVNGISFLCLRWQGLLRTVQMPGCRGRWRDSAFRNTSLQP